MSYELARRTAIEYNQGPLANWQLMLCGSCGGVGFWTFALPSDTVKSLIQTDTQGKYNGVVDCVRKTIATDGVGRFWRSWRVGYGRGIPGAAVTFTTYQLANDYILKFREDEKVASSNNTIANLDYAPTIISKQLSTAVTGRSLQ